MNKNKRTTTEKLIKEEEEGEEVFLSTQVFPSLVSFPSGQASQVALLLLGTLPLHFAHLPSSSYSSQSVILV